MRVARAPIPDGDRGALVVGIAGIAAFAGAVLSVTWLPARLDVVVTVATLGLLAFALSFVLARR